jgi:hypothetical protein
MYDRSKLFLRNVLLQLRTAALVDGPRFRDKYGKTPSRLSFYSINWQVLLFFVEKTDAHGTDACNVRNEPLALLINLQVNAGYHTRKADPRNALQRPVIHSGIVGWSSVGATRIKHRKIRMS